jgi:pyruvate dehydrogenase complex dehydrogenase (E1) component
LAKAGKIKKSVVVEAMKKYDSDATKINPLNA